MIFTHIRKSFAAAFFPRMSEWQAAFVLFGIGWMLSANPHLMANPRTEVYDLLLLIAPQQTWSLILVLFSTLRLLVLLINGAWRRSPHLRAAMAFISCFFWTPIMLTFMPIFGYAVCLATGYLAAEMLNIMHAMRDARTVDYSAARRKAGGHQ